MSFLIEATSRRAAAAASRAARTSIQASPASRAPFTTSLRLHKTVTESVKDTLKSADRAVSNKVADGLDAGGTRPSPHTFYFHHMLTQTFRTVEAKDKVKEAVAGKAPEVKGQAAGKAEELKGQAQEVAGEAKGKAAELKGKAKGKVNEL